MDLIDLDIAFRTFVMVALVYASLVALTHWAVRNRRLNPFGAWPRFVRSISEPLLLRLERRIIAAGGSPQNAPYWLLGLVVAGGLILLSLTQWIIGLVTGLSVAMDGGVRVWLQLVVNAVFTILMGAILVRVIASWFGIGPYRRWMRPVVLLTDWIIEPIRRILPPVGMFDFSPMVAWLVLYVVRGFVLGMI